MPTKNFYTANGMIFGESSGGTTTVYAPDGQGNVAATYSGGVKQNSYLYAPYGTLIEKTGTAADPKFLWNGGSGYRNTGRSYADLYVRARHYGITTAQWTSSDPLWPRERLWAYVNGRPFHFIDRTGEAAQTLGCRKPVLDIQTQCQSACEKIDQPYWTMGGGHTCDSITGTLIGGPFDCCSSAAASCCHYSCKACLCTCFDRNENGLTTGTTTPGPSVLIPGSLKAYANSYCNDTFNPGECISMYGYHSNLFEYYHFWSQ